MRKEEKRIMEEPTLPPTTSQGQQQQTDKKSEKNEITKNHGVTLLKKYGFLLLILIPLFLSAHYRMLPWDIPQAEAWATDQIMGHVQEKITNEVNQQHASLPEETKQELIEQGIQKEWKTNKEGYEQQKQLMIKQYKYNFQDRNGDTYLGAIDPFQYLRYTENVLDHGYMGEELRDGASYDTKMLAPIGKVSGFSLHPYLSAYIYKIVHFFKRDITVVQILFAMPATIIGLALIPLFFMVRKFGGNIAALIATSYVALDDNLLNRTMGGFADTDGYGILLPLLVMVFVIESLDTEANTKKKRMIFMLLAAFSMGLFTRTWTGWWVTLGLLIASGILYLLYLILLEHKDIFQQLRHLLDRSRNLKEKIKAGFLNIFWYKENIKTVWTMIFGFIIFSFVAIFLFRGWTYFKKIYINLIFVPLNYAQGGISSAVKNTQELWPNVYTTVAELNKISYTKIIEGMGGSLLLILACLGILFLFLQYKRRLNFFGGVMTTIWLFGMIYTAKAGGVRFIMNISPPLGLALGVFFAGLLKFTFRGISWLSKKRLLGNPLQKINWPLKILAGLIVALLILWFFGFSPAPPFCTDGMCKTAERIGKGVMPLIDKQWEDILVKVSEQSSPDAIMNSWWDFGHWFKYYAKRRVIFDGASQNIPQAHWMGRVLLTADEKESGAILRMMNCGGNKAYEILQNTNQNHITTMQTMKQLLMLSPKKPGNKAKIEGILKDKGLNTTETQKFWERMYCDPPEAYLVTSSDMTGKSAVWGHFGGWSFERALIWRDTRNLSEREAVAFMKQKLNYSSGKAIQMYNETRRLQDEGDGNSWISGWPSYLASGPCEKQERDIKPEMIPPEDPRRKQAMQDREEGKQRKTLLCVIPFGQQQLFLEIDEETKHALLVNTEPVQRPHVITWLEDGKDTPGRLSGQSGQTFGSHRYEESTASYGIALFKEGDQYFIRFMDGLLPASMYNRLFFYQGIGLKYFDLFARTRSITTGEIYIWKIHWDRME